MAEESRERPTRSQWALALSIAPALFFAFWDFRSEIETTANSWIGVIGYERTTRWLGIPVYQNFVNFGSPLPLMSHIASSPLALVGAVLPLQLAQSLSVVVALFALGVTLITSPLSTAFRGPLAALLALVITLPTAHYFFVNDWSDEVLATCGLYILILVLTEFMCLDRTMDFRQAFALWVGVALISLTHLGYLGAPIISLVLLSLIGMTLRVLRGHLTNKFLLILMLSLVTAIVGYLLFDIRYLWENGVPSNPRPRSVRSYVKEALTLGVLPSIQSLRSGDLLDAAYLLAERRTLFFLWPAMIIPAAARLVRLRRSGTLDQHHRVSTVLLVTCLVLAALGSLAGTSSYPLRPSADYMFRDAILPMAVLGLVLSRQRCSRDEAMTNSRRSRAGVKAVSVTVALIGAPALLWTLATASLAAENDSSEANAVCHSLGEEATIWVEAPIWFGEQPANPFIQDDCSLFQMIEDGQYSVAGQLRMRQTSSDGDPAFELINRTVEARPELLTPLLNAHIVRADRSLLTLPELPPEELAEAGAARYSRCLAGECVLTVDRTSSSPSRLIWNHDVNLRATGAANLEDSGDGYLIITSATGNDVTITYSPPLLQKVSVMSAWVLFAGIPAGLGVVWFTRRNSNRAREFAPAAMSNSA